MIGLFMLKMSWEIQMHNNTITHFFFINNSDFKAGRKLFMKMAKIGPKSCLYWLMVVYIFYQINNFLFCRGRKLFIFTLIIFEKQLHRKIIIKIQIIVNYCYFTFNKTLISYLFHMIFRLLVKIELKFLAFCKNLLKSCLAFLKIGPTKSCLY